MERSSSKPSATLSGNEHWELLKSELRCCGQLGASIRREQRVCHQNLNPLGSLWRELETLNDNFDFLSVLR